MMKLLFSPWFCLTLVAGCSSHAPTYRMESMAESLSRAEAEATHAQLRPDYVADESFDEPALIWVSRFPDYPANLMKAGVTGRVTVRFFVEPTGLVSQPSIVGSAPTELAAVTLDAISKWRFKPATKSGKPVQVICLQTFVFELK